MPMMVSVSGIRGIVGEDLVPPAIVAYTRAFAQVIRAEHVKRTGKKPKKPSVLIGRDTRPSGEYILKLVEGTLNASGFDTIDIGIATTPTILLATRKLGCTGGIAITASHNPSQWNALKFCNARGLFLADRSIQKIQYISEDLDSNVRWSDYAHNGYSRSEKEASSLHVQAVLNNIDVKSIRKKKFRVAIDPVGGTGCMIDSEFLEALGCTVIGIYDHPEHEFPRKPEPIPQNLNALEKIVRLKRADVGFAQDPDGDRLSIVSDAGKALGEEFTLVLAGEAFLRRTKTDIVCNLSTSMMVDRLAERYGVQVIRTKIGEINVTGEMLERCSEFGGEGNGGVIVPGINSCRDSIVAMGLVLELLANEDRELSLIVSTMPHFYMKKDWAVVPEMERDRLNTLIYDHTRGMFLHHSYTKLDGIKYYNNSEWLHIRTSNTEPIVRIMAESETAERTDRLIEIGKKCLGYIIEKKKRGIV